MKYLIVKPSFEDGVCYEHWLSVKIHCHKIKPWTTNGNDNDGVDISRVCKHSTMHYDQGESTKKCDLEVGKIQQKRRKFNEEWYNGQQLTSGAKP